MAEVAEAQIYDIQNYTHDADTYRGITQVDVTVNVARVRPFRQEGEKIATTIDQVADDGMFPVEFRMRSKSRAVLLTLLQQSKADATFDGKEPGAAGTKTFTLTNAVYQTSDGGIRVDREGEFSIRGYAEAFAENT